jgi:hypothetical protein
MARRPQSRGRKDERQSKVQVNLKLNSTLVYRLKDIASAHHTTQTYLVEEALKRLFDYLDNGGQMPLFPAV